MADVFAYLEGFGVSGGSPNKSTIIVTAPTGSTVTCKMGSTTKTATEKNGVWTFGGLGLGTWTITSTKGGDSATQDVAITRLTVEYVTIVYRITPEFTYTGDYEVVDDSDNPISDFASWKNNWKIRFLTSGTLTFTKLNGWNGQLDVFLVGGGGGGKAGYSSSSYGGGGGGGYTKTVMSVLVAIGQPYAIVVGAPGAGGASGRDSDGTAGGTSSAFGHTSSGGKAGYGAAGGSGLIRRGGNGGSGGGSGTDSDGGGSVGACGTDGGNGKGTYGGTGQGSTTREFGSSTGKLYSTGGDGAGSVAGANNTGDGGDGANGINTGAAGGSGIVIIRNHRGEAA